MHTDARKRTGSKRISEALGAALAAGIRDGSDEPSGQARERASQLLGLLCANRVDLADVEIAVGIDGVIEFTSLRGSNWIVVEVEPTDAKLVLTVMELPSKRILSVGSGITEKEVVQAFERAA